MWKLQQKKNYIREIASAWMRIWANLVNYNRTYNISEQYSIALLTCTERVTVSNVEKKQAHSDRMLNYFDSTVDFENTLRLCVCGFWGWGSGLRGHRGHYGRSITGKRRELAIISISHVRKYITATTKPINKTAGHALLNECWFYSTHSKRYGKKRTIINYAAAPAPRLKILFLFSALNWILSLGGIMADRRGSPLRSRRTDLRGNIDWWYRSTESDPEGYPSVNNVSVWRGASPLNHRWAVHTSGFNLHICTTTRRCVSERESYNTQKKDLKK